MQNFQSPLPVGMPTTVSANSNVLFLFTKREIPDHTIRSLSYNFNQQLVSNMVDSINNKTNKPTFLDSVSANTAIVPSRKGVNIKTSLLSNNWSFLLISDNNLANGAQDNLLPSKFLHMRFIYSGYCSEEPILPHSMNFEKPITNDQCKLIITRKVIINKLNYQISQTGAHVKEDVIGDILVAKYNNNMVNESLYSLAPSDAIDSVESSNTTESGESMFTTITNEDSLEVKDHIKISSSFQSPKNHLKTIVNSIYDGIEDIAMSENLGSFRDISDTFYANDVIYNNIRANLSYADDVEGMEGNDLFGINSQTNIFLQSLMKSYNPEIYIIKNQPTTQMSIIPQHIVSIETIFSSLISSCVPSYIINTKLSSVSFWYDSHNDVFEPYHFDSNVSCSQQELLVKWNSFTYLFKKELVPILRDNGGEFNVLINCTTNASTYVKLNFYDNGKVFGVDDYYEHSNIPGGLCTNMIGGASTLSNNGSLLYNMASNISNAIMPNSVSW